MAAYVIGDVEVIDSAAYDEYRSRVPATVAAYGGRYLARGGAVVAVEGGWSPSRCVILEFPSMAQLKTWYTSPEYTPLQAIRARATKSKMIFTEGI